MNRVAIIAILVALTGLKPIIAADTKPNKPDSLTKIDGISIDLCKKEYTFTLDEVKKGVKLCYNVVVGKKLTGIIPLPQDSGRALGAGKSGLYPFYKIHGNGQSYSLQDVGLAPPVKRKPQTIKPGNWLLSFEWDGRNWTGPSDFGNPKGKPFPPGTYEYTVSLVGKIKTPQGMQPYRIAESVKLHLKK